MPSLIRLYTDQPLQVGINITLDDSQNHYLRLVMRRREGDEIELFNNRDGGFKAQIVTLSKKKCELTLKLLYRPPIEERVITLYFAPIKKTPLEMIAQKTTELGVSKLAPVRTQRTVVKHYNGERLRAIAIEASEQCERLSVPDIMAEVSLDQMLEGLSHPVYFADEAGDNPDALWGGKEGRAAPFLSVLRDTPPKESTELGILIGPEGGFTPNEREQIRAHPLCQPVGLGHTILRADTAAIVTMVLLMASIDSNIDRNSGE